jgi:hypothetical protein
VRRWFFRTWEQCQIAFTSLPRDGEPTTEEIVAQAEIELDSLHSAEGWPLSFAERLLKADGRVVNPADVQRMAVYVGRSILGVE